MEQERNEVREDLRDETDLSSAAAPDGGGRGAGGPETPQETPLPSLLDALPKETADELCSIFSCSREALEVILRSTSGDPSKILALVRTLTPEYIAVKVRFDARKRGELGGALCFVARGNTGEILDESFWVSGKSLPETFDIGAGWESVRTAISTIGGTPERTLYTRMLKAAKAVFTPTAVNKLFQSESAKEEILSALGEAFSEIVHYDLVYNLETEIFNKARLEAGGITVDEKPKEAPVREDENDPSVLGSLGTVQVPCRPVLDPVHGKAVSDLKRGDVVEVELEKTGGVSAIISKVFERSGERPAFPVLSVERLPSSRLLVKLHISEGIEGVLSAGTDLKLKTGDKAAAKILGKNAPFAVGKVFAATVLFLLLAVLFFFFFGR
ncbi:MAG: hypothetical protein PWP47_775 [Synergistaceae bacterium]|jgi:hypothetical protein|nr:hypothetical protein [Synergistaceae bacterium]